MLDSSSFYNPWPPNQWQQQQYPYARRATADLRIADFSTPAANGVDPKWEGWVYVKVNIWDGECKVGYTDGPITGRLIETGDPHLVLHAAFSVPWGNNFAHAAEQHCHNRLGRHNMVPHVTTGNPSERFRGPVEHITNQVVVAMQEFYDYTFRMCDYRFLVQNMRYEPTYRPEIISRVSNLNAPYWARRFNRITLEDRWRLSPPFA